jgi:hypothetical protein
VPGTTLLILGTLAAIYPIAMMAQIPTISVTRPVPPPAWALMERALLAENVRLMEKFAGHYVDPLTGHLQCVETWGGGDGPDDAMENFYSWPLVYMLGGPPRSLDLFHNVWNGHIDQYSKKGMLHREFMPAFDWEHNGEHMAAFNLLPLADPTSSLTRQRMVRFANFYTGRDPAVQNYDPTHRIIRGVHNGSKGPRFAVKMDTWPEAEKFVDNTFRKGINELEGDYPLNLLSTSLAANAYLLTGDEHYRDWVREYTGAWMERTRANGGMIPSNIGLDGKHQGKWYEGFFGWNYWFGGWGIIGRGMRVGFNNAYLLTGDPQLLDTLRLQGDALLKNRVRTADGGVYFLNKFGDKGWYEEARFPAHYSARNAAFEGLFADLYLRTFSDEDLKRLYDAAWPKPAERRAAPTWKFEYEDGHYDAGNEVLWIDYLTGNFPGYPDKALREAFQRIRLGVSFIENDTTTPDTRRADTPHGKGARKDYQLPNAVIGAVTGSLINLTMGGTQPLWSGGLLHAQLRYFDPAAQRPGLPQDVAALVTKITRGTVHVTVVNVNQTDAREVIIQTGAYAEHQCERVETDGKSLPVNLPYFQLRLAPGAGADLVIHRRLMANKPTLSLPTQR